ncbi:Transcription factor/nuclear export subunit protein 2 [Fragilaria crotonensis]|nr:Transcription factor/nuclear export subunit protein 2 [Fragilaria crotonensis]
MGRQVSKVTHSNPLVVFSTILGQIESYDNLIQMMVETIRLVTPLSLDVLGYCVLTRLSGVGGVNRSRLKDDGVNVSQWLQSLEAFTGAFYRACPEVEFRGILSYLVHRLKTGHVLELGVLKTLIKSAGGYSFADYSPAASLSSSQLEGRAGSLLLKRETFAFGIVDNFDFRASDRVRSVLQGNDFGVTILILLAQTRVRLLFDSKGSKKKHVKLVANLLDTCQVVMYILLEFITDSSMSKLAKNNGKVSKGTTNAIETYASSLPSIHELFDVFKLDAVSAWMLCRPIFRAVLSGETSEHFERHKGDRKQSAHGMLPEDAWNHITPNLFDTFFSFSLYDIHFPEIAYKTQLTRLNDTEQRLTNKKKNHKSGVHGLEFTAEDESALERVKASADALAEDMEKQKKHCQSIRKHIAADAKTMFQSREVPVTAMQTFITYCIYPRCKLNPDEATYCVRFIMTLHALKTPGFSTMNFIDEFVKVLSACSTLVRRMRRRQLAFFSLSCGKWSVDGDYKVLYNKWHAAIGEATIGCLDSTEYMHVRSSFVVLSRIVDAFPTRPKLGQTLLDALEPLQDETYPLQDIKTAAHAYGTLLIKARGDGVWKEEDSATIKAREEKEKADIAAKLKRREEQLADMKRDMEKIDVEIEILEER